MNKRKGFLRLTIVLSIVVAIIIPFYMKDAFRHTICEAEEKVYESPNPPEYQVPGSVGRQGYGGLKPPIDIGGHPVQPPKPPKVTFTFSTPSNGVVRSTRKVMFKCNDKLSLVMNVEGLNKIFEDNLGKIAVEKSEGAYITYSYTILGEKDVFEWKGFIGMGIKSFILVWFVYAFIRWVIIAFVVGGFKNKS